MSEGGQQQREPTAEPTGRASARFPEPVPSPRPRGRVALTSSSNAELVGLMTAAGLAVASTYVVAHAAVTIPLWAWLPFVMLATAVWASVARTRRAELSWDPWGLTLDEQGERIAIPWSAARAYVKNERKRTTVQVSDDEGRAITVYQGTAPGIDPEPRRTADLAGLLAAVAELPRAESLLPERGAPPVLFTLAAFAAFAITMAHFAVAGRPLVALGAVFVGAMSLRALHEAARVWKRARALRGARPVRVTGAAAGPLRAKLGDEPVVLRLAEPVADARLGERDEPVLVVLGSDGSLDGSSPYRDARVVSVRALETTGERASRRRRLASGLARFAAGVVTIASWAVLVPAPAVLPMRQQEIQVLGPRPEPPRARPIAPRPPSDLHEEARAVEAWRASGPHFEHTLRCTGGRGCVRVPVFVDPRTGTRIVCDDEHQRECMRLSASGGLPLAPLPEPAE